MPKRPRRNPSHQTPNHCTPDKQRPQLGHTPRDHLKNRHWDYHQGIERALLEQKRQGVRLAISKQRQHVKPGNNKADYYTKYQTADRHGAATWHCLYLDYCA
jgi:hypothetical protein